ncbi:DUF190 domain-containing protein [Solemya velum gill symbiont]|uniref:DUF190 domain-containing protein n=1 Tax=Solemya velum gill symbiont TaxID=2340 RepID=UPI000997FB4B|nr:DUF190 domain-containing protein [Solemya velum gill symbiont]OOY56367.1 hypothetical protein BOV99_04985 [Solemya velum gill symbiont]OOY57914.1 hypothetical protein BOW00_04970 [Solemya velum gill symbiont]OOY69853.1 hypothetical protein BOW07_06870 [Solemya velum gill symbiont]OOY84558.1 hypothetical protein BOW14_11760 [Solemya velum gill symbiont]OOY94568.1 hypothetical protein BOW17_05730 [Solemya velum gill symbiont]
MSKARLVRIYLMEAGDHLHALLEKLRSQETLRGVTVFIGDSGKLHAASLVDLSLELPVVVEFFDTPQRVEQILAHLADDLPAGHVISWDVELND